MKITEETIQQVLDSIYDNVLVGLPGSESVYELAEAYMVRHGNVPEAAARSLIKYQVAKCAASGFISGLGGALILPVSVPADLAANYYIQMRMSAAIAYMYGHDIISDQVKTFIYLSLVGEGVKDMVRGVSVQLGMQMSRKAIKTLSQELILKINRVIGMRLITMFGQKGAMNLVKLVPVAGGLVGGGVNYYYCAKIGHAAVELFGKDDQWVA